MINAGAMARVSGIFRVNVVPRPTDRRQRHRAADRLDIFAHYVHADAAAGNAGHLTSGRKSWSENKATKLVVGHARQFGLADET